KDTYGVTDIRRPQKVADRSQEEKLRYDSEIRAVNIILLGLPIDIYTLFNHFQTAKEIWDRVKELMEGTNMTKHEPRDILLQITNSEPHPIQELKLKFKMAKLWFKMFKEDNLKVMQAMLERVKLQEQGLEENDDCDDLQLHTTSNFKADHVDAYESDCDDQATTSAIFMASHSPAGLLNDDTVAPTYDSNTLFEAEYTKHSVSHDDLYAEFMSDSNVISYAKYMVTIEDKATHYVPPPIKDKDMILSVTEQMKSQVEQCNTIKQKAKSIDESLTTELEKYKARVKTLEKEYSSKQFLTKREAL
ncbi:hypothetical protein Tco_0191022, partial [Tanacetum coccineum]